MTACRFPLERLLLTASDSTGCPGNSVRRLHSRRSMGKAAAGFSAPKSIKYLAVTCSLIQSLASRAGRHYDIVLTTHDHVAAFSAYGRWRNLCEAITRQRNIQIIKYISFRSVFNISHSITYKIYKIDAEIIFLIYFPK